MSRRGDHVLIEEHLPPDQALLFTALRSEFNAKLSSLKAWGVAALVGGQVAAGLLTAYVGPSHAAAMAEHFIHSLV